jgi:hypothetical protein
MGPSNREQIGQITLMTHGIPPPSLQLCCHRCQLALANADGYAPWGAARQQLDTLSLLATRTRALATAADLDSALLAQGLGLQVSCDNLRIRHALQ